MINKILKVELFTLFLFTLVAFFAFYYQSVLPDNFFSISSETNKINFLSYYCISFIATIGFYTGPWVFLPFVLFSLFYTIKFSKREYLGDSFLVISILIFFMSLSYLLVPALLGEGLNHILSHSFTKPWAAVIFVISIFVFLLGSFRASFKTAIINVHDFIINIPENLRRRAIRKRNAMNLPLQRTKSINVINRCKNSISTYLKGFKKEKLEEEKNGLPMIAADRSSKIEVKESSEYKQNSFFQDSMLEKKDVVPEKERFNRDNNEVKINEEDGPKLVHGYLKQKSNIALDQKYREILAKVQLESKHKKIVGPNDHYFNEIIMLLEDKLKEFKISAEIINVLKGPVVDTFELELGSGVKVSKVTGATEDLSLALYGSPIRIVYPLKGKTTVGIEVPRNPREFIYLDELVESKDYKETDFSLPIALGKDAFGDAFIADLAKMPHMLVAGATGAGKSVFINAILVSLLLKKSPQQLQLILIDPKQLELALYSNLPHLAMPIITDAKTASISLLWATQEMERRYSILKDFGVRGIDSFNEKLKSATPAMLAKIHGHYENSSSDEYELPFLVIIIDEFADLILTKAGKEIESNVSRLAAKARAAGIHIVLATQRPSVDVITGVIKSNFPTRVSFRVSSPIDSRTILDKMGAERLLGKGDMLYKHGIESMRVHSSFIEETEIESICSELEQMGTNFSEHIMDFLENGGDLEVDAYTYGSHISPSDDKGTDSMFKEAMRVCAEQGSASASMLQRTFEDWL